MDIFRGAGALLFEVLARLFTVWARGGYPRQLNIGGYTACRIPLVWSANRNRNGILLNRIPFNGILFPFASIKKIFASSVSVRFR